MNDDASAVVHLALARSITIAVAESLTGGDLTSAMVSVPGSSDALRGGVVAYHVDIKHDVLGVDQRLLDDAGPVSEPVAIAMAHGARGALNADIGVATTGVAGPEPHGGEEPGTVWVAVDMAEGAVARRLEISGQRADVRAGAVHAALAVLLEALGGPRAEETDQSGTQLR